MNTEKATIRRFEELIERSPFLDSEFDKNDKTPFTDGHVDIMAIPEVAKRNFVGRVYVQIKGRKAPKRAAKTVSFQFNKTDLMGYRELGGVLFLLGSLNRSSEKVSPYYSLLSPFRIEKLLKDSRENSKSVSIELGRFPTGVEKIEALLRLALESRKEQAGIEVTETFLENIDELTVTFAGSLNFGAPVLLRRAEADFTVSASTSDGIPVPVPIDIEIIPEDYIEHPFGHEIKMGDLIFEDATRRKIDDSRVEIRLSREISLTLDRSGERVVGELSLTRSDVLEKRLSGLKLFQAFDGCVELSLSGKPVTFEADSGAFLRDLSEELRVLEGLREVLERLDAKASLVRLSEVTERQWSQLAALHSTVVEGQEYVNRSGQPGRIRQPIGDWLIELICVKRVGEEGWSLRSLTDPEAGAFMVSAPSANVGSGRLVTPYEIIDDAHFARTLNLNFDGLLYFYQSLPDDSDRYSLANRTVLRLIKSADEISERSEEFLEAALRLNSWLVELGGHEAADRINNWQIEYRTEGLSDSFRVEVRQLKYDDSVMGREDQHIIQMSCSLLLEDWEDAYYFFSRLSGSQKEAVRDWPIVNLFPPDGPFARLNT